MPQPVLGERLSPAGGISIAGIDLTRPLPPEARDTIIAAILAHHIAIFPGQSLSREQQFAFAANFGEVERHGTGKRHGVAHVMSNLGTSPFRGEGRHHAHSIGCGGIPIEMAYQVEYAKTGNQAESDRAAAC